MARISSSVRAPSSSTLFQRLDGGGRIGTGDHAASLGADHDGRDVVGHGVVQFAGEAVALA